ncbi:UNVERIFIED_CONTAM: hypothetical protein PYX00_011701 [Menopon gallinae]|uniref:Uncharacterized protein n=1 Tax=Menopon gallinae TaxID=328185 RepID=A0AAW2H8H3_9NEOP
MELCGDALRRFRRIKQFNEDERIRCARYSPSGGLLCVALGRRLKVCNALSGTVKNIVSVEAPVLAHVTESSVLYASDQNIRLLSLHDNKHVHVFKSHTGNVQSISASPVSDFFLSSCRGGVRLWSIGYRNPVYKADLRDGIAAFVANDNFVIATDALLQFYDIRSPVGPFKVTAIPCRRHREMSATSRYLCVSGERSHHVFDFEGRLVHTVETARASHVALTPDSQYSVCSSGAYLIFTEIASERRVHTAKEREGNLGAVVFNPQYAQLATFSRELNLWMPVATTPAAPGIYLCIFTNIFSALFVISSSPSPPRIRVGVLAL